MSKITIFKNIRSTGEPQYIEYKQALTRISSGKSRTKVEAVRLSNTKDDVTKFKERLPLVMFSGVFDIMQETSGGFLTYATEDSMSQHSGLICLDFDGLAGDVDKFKELLIEDDIIHAAWISPSGEGVKALVKIAQPEKHREHFYWLMEKYPELDASGENPNRGCYESYDPYLYVNENSKVVSETLAEKPANIIELKKSTVVSDPSLIGTCVAIIKNSVDGAKHDAARRAGYLAGGFIGGGLVNDAEIVKALEEALKERCGEDSRSYREHIRAIYSGIQKGKTKPIEEVEADIAAADRHKRIEMLSLEDFVEGNLDVEIQRYLTTGEILGLDTGSEIWDRHFRYKPENFVINLGHSNTGKSTFSWWVAVLSAKRHGWKWGIYSSENTLWRLKKKLMEFYFSKPALSFTKAEVNEATSWVDKHFFFITNKYTYNYKQILDFATKLVEEKHINAMLVDPYNSLRKESDDTHNYDYTALSEMLTWTKRYGRMIWCNMHTVTEAQRLRDTKTNKVKRPYAAHAEGGGKNVNRCDDLYITHRNIHSSGESHITEFYVDKVREVETGGKPTLIDSPLKFEMEPDGCGYTINGYNPITKEQRDGIF